MKTDTETLIIVSKGTIVEEGIRYIESPKHVHFETESPLKDENLKKSYSALTLDPLIRGMCPSSPMNPKTSDNCLEPITLEDEEVYLKKTPYHSRATKGKNRISYGSP